MGGCNTPGSFSLPQSELNVGHTRGTFHAVTLLLAVMLAWPWNVALTTVESSGPLTKAGDSVLTKQSHRARQIKRSLRWGTATTPALSPDFDEEEEWDDAGTWSVGMVVPKPSEPPLELMMPAARGFSLVILRPLPLSYLCRLRC